MLSKKILIILQFLPILFATSHSEAKLRCENIYGQTKKNADEIQNNDLSNIANKALDLIQSIITTIENQNAKELPQQIKRCMTLSDCVATLKNELATLSCKDFKKVDPKKTEEARTEIPPKKKHKQQVDPEKGAIDLSEKLTEIAKEVSGNFSQKKDTDR